MIQISFGYSSSQNYQMALIAAEAAGLISTGEGKVIRHTAGYDFADFPKAVKLWDLVDNWKSATFEVDAEELDRAGIGRLRDIYDCWKKGHDLPNPEAYCRPVSPRHEHPQDEIQRMLTRCRKLRILKWGFSWREHGYVTVNGGWAVDKEWIKGQAENELWKTRTDLCPLFDRAALEKALDEIPEELDLRWINERAEPPRQNVPNLGTDKVIRLVPRSE